MMRVTITYLDGTIEALDTTESYTQHLISKGLEFVDKISIVRYQ